MNTTKPLQIDEVSHLIRDGVPVVFETMLQLQAQSMPVDDLAFSDEEIVVGSVGFIGDANGMVYIHLTAELARIAASQMLRMPAVELDDEMVNDVIGELSNMIVGSVKSQLCDSGAPCTLTIPSIIRGKSFSIERTSSEERQLLGFACGNEAVLILILMKQPPTRKSYES